MGFAFQTDVGRMEAFQAEYMTLAATARTKLRMRTEPLTLRLLLAPHYTSTRATPHITVPLTR
jgi:hypothetical protein